MASESETCVMTPRKRAAKIIEQYYQEPVSKRPQIAGLITHAIEDALSARERDIERAVEHLRKVRENDGWWHVESRIGQAIEALQKPEVKRAE